MRISSQKFMEFILEREWVKRTNKVMSFEEWCEAFDLLEDE